MSKQNSTRRQFIKQSSLAGMGAILATGIAPNVFTNSIKGSGTPAILGGQPSWSKNRWPEWPVWNPETDEAGVLEALRSGVWSRAGKVKQFEKEWADMLGAKRCLAVVNGTNALEIALAQLNVEEGDEVIVPPYTFIATISSVLANGAMPVFVDVDPETFQIDPDKIESKITSRTKAILPVHLAGLPADMDRINAIAKKHNLVVIEDACQAHLAEINHKKVGTLSDAGCFSFQNSKNLPIGEGGAILSDNDDFMDRCYSYHNYGLSYGTMIGSVGKGAVISGTKLRFSEYQAAIGLAQLKRLEAQTTTRSENASYLRSQIKEIPGIEPYKLYDNVTRAAFHLFPFRFKQEEFKGLTRGEFLGALSAEGIPMSSGYRTLNDQPYLSDAFQSKRFQLAFPKSMLNFNDYVERNQCPENERLCNEEAVWFGQNMLLASRADMDAIASAIEKVYANADKIKRINTEVKK
jgi:perosamine synthetase